MRQWRQQQHGKLWRRPECEGRWRCAAQSWGRPMVRHRCRGSGLLPQGNSSHEAGFGMYLSPWRSSAWVWRSWSAQPGEGSPDCAHAAQEPLLGTFPYFSGKIAAAGMARGRCIAHMFAMRVAEELPTWPEGSTRQRVWVRTRHHELHGTRLFEVRVAGRLLTWRIGSMRQRVWVCLDADTRGEIMETVLPETCMF